MTIKKNFTAVLPLRSFSVDNASSKYSTKAINVLIQQIKDTGILINNEIVKVETEIKDTKSSEHNLIYRFIMKEWTYSIQYLSFKFITSFPNSLKGEQLNIFNYDICYQFSDLISELFLYLNISYPGCISYFKGAVFCDENLVTYIPEINFSINDAFNISTEVKYPQFIPLDFLNVISWIEKNNINIYEVPKSKIEKAINCLTHVCHSDGNTCEKLIFSLMALEVLYTKGNSNITEQLNEKIQIFLGPLPDSKKLIKTMYSIRSRFLHGDLPLLSYTMYGNTFAKYEEEIYQSFNLSVSILIATLQKMIHTDKKQLDFTLKLVS